MCLRFADLERKLGEIDRARAIYAHASQIADPRVSEIHSDLIILNWMAKLSDTLLHFQILYYIFISYYKVLIILQKIHNKIFLFQVAANFWQVWKEFEIKHGNEDTVREMLRIKRSVQAIYNTQVNFMSAQMLAASSGKGDNAGKRHNELIL